MGDGCGLKCLIARHKERIVLTGPDDVYRIMKNILFREQKIDRDKEHFFAPDFSNVSYGGRTYLQVGEHRYQSINESNKPLVLIYSENGFVLNVYNPGDDPTIIEPCLAFKFTFAD